MVIAAVSDGVYAIGVPASAFVNQMPLQARKLRIAIEGNIRDGGSTIDRVKQAANEIEKVATTAASPPPAPAGVQRVRVEEPPFRVGDLLWRGSRGLLEFLASIVVVFFLDVRTCCSRETCTAASSPSSRDRRSAAVAWFFAS